MKDIFKQRDCLSQDEIKQYLQEKMSHEKAHDVENHLLNCPFCKDAMEGYANVHNFEEVEQVLADAEPELATPDPKVVQMPAQPPRRMFLRIAAAILLLLLPLSAILYWSSGDDNRLYANYINALEANSELALRGKTDTVRKAEVFYQGLKVFDGKDYQKSVTYFSTALREHPDDLQVAFFCGLSNLKAGHTDEAIPLLERVLKDKNSGYEHDSSWYLALAYLKKGDNQRAKSLLTLLLTSDNYYNKKAASLLTEL